MTMKRISYSHVCFPIAIIMVGERITVTPFIGVWIEIIKEN